MALRPHDIDDVIGEKKRPAESIADDLAASRAFRELVARAVALSDELPPGMCGASFGQQVRVAIARDLLHEQVAAAQTAN